MTAIQFLQKYLKYYCQCIVVYCLQLAAFTKQILETNNVCHTENHEKARRPF